MAIEWVGWAVGGLAALVLAGVWWYGRRQVIQRAVHNDKCPQCGQDKWHRIHRHLPDHVFGVGLKVRRYRCANSECNWEGLRRRANG